MQVWRESIVAIGLLVLAVGVPAFGQGPGQGPSRSGVGLPTVPTTKVLAIGVITPGPGGPAAVRPVMPSEVRETVKLYLAGKIDQWYVRQDKNGVVFLMNVASVEEAHALLEKLPLGVAKLMEFQLIPLGPLTPLTVLLAPPAAPVAAEK